MKWHERVNDTINYIEENLDKDISYDVISKRSACSIYNFQRMFSYIADISLSDYIRNRRLTLAAFEILNGKENIIDIAMKYGYSSHDAFTRAFQRFHGVIPSKVRIETVMLKTCPKLSFQMSIKGEEYMNFKIEKFHAFTISGIKKTVSTEKAFEMIPRVWEEAGRDGTMRELFKLLTKTDLRPGGLLGISVGGKWGKSDEMVYYLGVTTHVDFMETKKVTIPSNMVKLDFPEATWVIFDANGPLPDSVQNIYKKFYTEWLPNSGFDLVDLPVIECFFQDDRQEVWIAIKEQ